LIFHDTTFLVNNRNKHQDFPMKNQFCSINLVGNPIFQVEFGLSGMVDGSFLELFHLPSPHSHPQKKRTFAAIFAKNRIGNYS